MVPLLTTRHPVRAGGGKKLIFCYRGTTNRDQLTEESMNGRLQLTDLPPEIFHQLTQYFDLVTCVRAGMTHRNWYFSLEPRNTVSTYAHKVVEAARIGNFEFVARKIGTNNEHRVFRELLVIAVRHHNPALIDLVFKYTQSDIVWGPAASILVADQNWTTIAEIIQKRQSLYWVFIRKAILLGDTDLIANLPPRITRENTIIADIFAGKFDFSGPRLKSMQSWLSASKYSKLFRAVILAHRYDEENIGDLMQIIANIWPTHSSDRAVVASLCKIIFKSPLALEFLEHFQSIHSSKFDNWITTMFKIACRSYCAEVVQFFNCAHDIQIAKHRTDFRKFTTTWLLESEDFARDHQFVLAQGLRVDCRYFITLAGQYKKRAKIYEIIESATGPAIDSDQYYKCLKDVISSHGPRALVKIWSRNPNPDSRPHVATAIWRAIVGLSHVACCQEALRVNIPQPADLLEQIESACIARPRQRRDNHQILALVRQYNHDREKIGEKKMRS
jgi:hypothetical protein